MKETMGQIIRRLRKEQNLTQEELAAKAKISATHMGVIERGVKAPNLDTFVSIANALGVSADDLLQDVVDQSSNYPATELSRMIANQTPDMQRRIYQAVRALTED